MFTDARVGSRHEIAQVDVAAMRREGLRASPAQRGRGAQNIKNCVFLDHVTKGRTLLWVRSCTARLTRRYFQPLAEYATDQAVNISTPTGLHGYVCSTWS